MNTERHFDGHIKRALENLQAKDNGLAWEAFAQRLGQQQPDAANDSALDADTSQAAPIKGADLPFDELIATKLNHVEVPLAVGDWGMMEKMIEADETAELLENEAVLDNLVSEKLEHFQVAFQPHHWQMMAHRLEEEFFVRYHLLRCKAAEVGLMLLLLLTIVRFTPIFESKEATPSSAIWPMDTAPLPAPQPIELSKLVGKAPIIAAAAPTPASGLQNSNSLSVPKNLKQEASEGLKKATSPNLPSEDYSSSSSFATASQGFPPSSSTLIDGLPLLGLSPIASVGLPANLFEQVAAHKLKKNTLQTPGMDTEALKNAPLLASLGVQPVQSKYAWEIPQLPERIFEKERQIRFSIFTSTDIAYVLTPPSKYSVFDTLIATGHDTTLASGYGGGIAISWKKDKWEFQTGGIYSFKRYIPNTPVIFFETVNYIIREEFNGVQLDILEVPLNASYHLKNEGKWRIYTNFGASGHFITSSVYEVASSRTPSPRNFVMMPPVTTDGLPDDNESITEEKEFPKGLLDGGTVYDNFYLTANVGFGMERYVSPRWSLFFQPNYQHHILTDGIGVNGEKLYNFSFNFGTKVSLK